VIEKVSYLPFHVMNCTSLKWPQFAPKYGRSQRRPTTISRSISCPSVADDCYAGESANDEAAL